MTRYLRTISLFGLFTAAFAVADDKIDFNRDVRPILSDKCFHCHGPDSTNQKSDLRFDSEERLFAEYDGVKAVVPGDLKNSEIYWRIHSDDSDEQMPPPESNRSLSKEQKEILDKWIQQGAPYSKHWAFELPQKADLPKLNHDWQKSWAKNPIDHFVADKLYEKGLEPTPRASDETLRRRASLALTGLQPTPEEIAQFSDYASEVDRLLGTMDFAERQALRWLDAARYADTDGFQNDAERKNWPWRDWVIKAFHENKPFDEFTVEQIAGDMLENATPEQILASAFNRNHRQNSEGGALAAEFFVENVIDRVETTSTVWLGLTMGCARCHDHKYDPLSQREFYQMFAYFNNIGENGFGKGVKANPVSNMTSPLAKVPEDLLTKIEKARREITSAEKTSAERSKKWAAELAAEIASGKKPAQSWTTAAFVKTSVGNGTSLQPQDGGSLLITGKKQAKATYSLSMKTAGLKTVTAFAVNALPHSSLTKPRQLARSVNGNFVLSEVELLHNGKPVTIASASATFEQDKYPVKNSIDGNPGTGWAVYGADPKPEKVSAYYVLATPVQVKPGDSLELRMKHESGFASHIVGHFSIGLTAIENPGLHLPGKDTLSQELISAVQVPEANRTPPQAKLIADSFAKMDSALLGAKANLAALETEKTKHGMAPVPVMVMKEKAGEPTPAYLLNRGQYDEPDKSEVLPRSLPISIFPGDPETMPKDRLELARWLVSRENPLTARVVINRMWQDLFGIGLVKTAEDFGIQGEMPEYQDLLDWLAVEFIESGWDVKQMFKLILTSATFQQGSVVDSTLYGRDPENRWLARGARFRLDGFSIRDVALHASGLLNEKVGGSPVKPYQPAGLWNVVGSNAGTRYPIGKGEDLYRKSLYTYWKRAVNPPRQIIFDAGGRETCNVRTRRTNTPLQALALMNDRTFIEAARHVAERVLTDPELKNDRAKMGRIYQLVTAREIQLEHEKVLAGTLKYFREHFSRDKEAAAMFLATGDSKRDESIDPVEHAAWASAAHVILNLDESITLE